GELERAPLLVELPVELGLGDVERVQARKAGGLEIDVPVESGRERLQTRGVGLVEELMGIAALSAGERGARERSLDLHDLCGFAPCRAGRVALQLEHARDVGRVAGAEVLGPGVVLRVEIAVGQAESARAGEGDHPGRVRVVLIRIEAEERARPGREMQRGEHRGEIALRFHPEYPLEMRLQGPPARFLDRGLVHAGGEIIPDLPLRGAPPGAALRQDIENSPEETLVLARALAVY